jgi:alpha-N-acetylglucosaminidase
MLSALLLAGALGSVPAPTQVAGPLRRPVDLPAISALVDRVVPGHARDFTVEVIPDSAGLEVFEVNQDAGHVVLRGSSGVALASALNWYLEHVAGVSVSLPLQPIHLGTLPAVPARVRLTTRYRIRYFFNYCTFSYSMAWWRWDDWQRMIDWTALNGVNAPLAVTGQEAVWQLVLRDFGSAGPRSRSFSSALPTSPGAGWETSTAWAVRSPTPGSRATSPSNARASHASAPWG